MNLIDFIETISEDFTCIYFDRIPDRDVYFTSFDLKTEPRLLKRFCDHEVRYFTCNPDALFNYQKYYVFLS